MRDALEREMPEDARWSRPQGGYFTWLDFPPGTETSDVLARGEEQGVTFVAGCDFFPPGRGGESSARLAFSYVSPDEISVGVARLAALLRELRSSPVAV
jgi:DNA-binding transcriptional MocR family regulator